MPEGAPFRKIWIDSGRTKADLKKLTDPFDPLTYATGLAGKRMLFIAGKVDEVVPPACTRALMGSRRQAADHLVRLRTLLRSGVLAAGYQADGGVF